jgi:hypothetical protein
VLAHSQERKTSVRFLLDRRFFIGGSASEVRG